MSTPSPHGERALWLELKIPPPVVTLCTAGLMWLAPPVFGVDETPFGVRLGAAVMLAALGVGIALSGVILFRQSRTTINPTRPSATTALVTGGIYRRTRNPMYVGLLLVLLGWAAYLANPLALVPIPLFVLYIGRFQIRPEERALAARFGEDYAAYCARVRRWL